MYEGPIVWHHCISCLDCEPKRTDLPYFTGRPGIRIQNPGISGIIIAIICILLLVCTPAWGVTLDDHHLEGRDDTGRLTGPALTFTAGDRVVSVVRLQGAAGGETIQWVFLGPNEIEWNQSQVLTRDQVDAASQLDLKRWPGVRGTGHWTISVLLNGEQASSGEFQVEPLTGLVWWGPFLGAALLVIGILVILGIALIIIVVTKKKSIRPK